MLSTAGTEVAAAVLDTALDATVSTTVGLVVGVVVFPVRWALLWWSQRRQENLNAYRDALRILRSAQRDARYRTAVEGVPVNREAIPDASWTEALHRLAEAPDSATYQQIEQIADLSARSLALAVLFPSEAGEDPRGDLAEHAVSLLTHRMKHPRKRPSDIEESLKSIREAAEAADEELDERRRSRRCGAPTRRRPDSRGRDCPAIQLPGSPRPTRARSAGCHRLQSQRRAPSDTLTRWRSQKGYRCAGPLARFELKPARTPPAPG